MHLSNFIAIGLLLGISLGCESSRDATPSAEQLALSAPEGIDVAALSGLLESDAPPKLFDANNEKTRAKYGTIPGSTLLASSSGYDTGVLPDDKSDKLVFYCANPRCKAGESAAKRAAEAGYDDINVLRAGIAGWVEAGNPTAPVN